MAIVVIMLAVLALIVMRDDPSAHIVIIMVVFLMLGLLPAAGIIGSLPDVLEANDPDMALVNGGLVQSKWFC